MTIRSVILACVLAVGVSGCARPRREEAVPVADARQHVALGVGLENIGDLDKAEKAYRVGLRNPETRATALTNLGNLRSAQGRVKEAEGYYRTSIEEARSAEALNNLAWMYVVHRMSLQTAARLASEAVDLADTPDVRAACAHTAGLAESLRGRTAEAEAWLARAAEWEALAADGKVSEATAFDLARHRLLLGNHKGALKAIDMARVSGGGRLESLRQSALRRMEAESKANASSAAETDEDPPASRRETD